MTSGGLKLSVEGAGRGDRRIRFATVHLAASGAQSELTLVTDARGRLRYRLAPGNYRLRLQHGGDACFTVTAGWTPVRLALP